jgi:aryl-alcohol dehydrogenase-like predicted oxidoreductase
VTKIPIEDTVGAVADLIRAGKVRHVGCRVPAATLRRRRRCTQSWRCKRYSRRGRGVEAEIPPTTRRFGVGSLPHSPLGRGFSGQSDARVRRSRLRHRIHASPTNFAKNLAIVDVLNEIGRAGASAAQVALVCSPGATTWC